MAPPKTTNTCKNKTKKQTAMKTSKRRRKPKFAVHGDEVQIPPILDCLPPEMMTEVLTRVAASSLVDLFRCKLSCKALHELSSEKEIMQQVSLDYLLYPCLWRAANSNATPFLMRCLECNNPHALLHLGLVEYFRDMKMEEGLEKLEKAAEQGNKEAGYVLGLILVCSEEKECVKKGVKLLLNIMRAIRGKGIVDCRKKLSDMMRGMLVVNKLIAETKPPQIACALQRRHEVQNLWERDYYYYEDNEDTVVCEACKVAREINFFFHVLGK